MNNRHFAKQLVFIVGFILSACSSNDEIFTENVNVIGLDPRLIEFHESGIMEAKMTDETTISGYTQNFRFTTSNYFKNFLRINGGIGFNKIRYEDAANVVLYDYDGNTFHLSITDITLNDNSSSYKTRFTLNPRESKKIGEYYYTGDVKYKDAFFLTKDTGWIVAKYERSGNGPDANLFPHGIRIYKVDGEQCTQLGVIEGWSYDPADVYFRNENEGWVIATDRSQNNKGVIFKTVDSGTHWTKVQTFEALVKRIIPIDSENLLLLAEKGVFQSSDNGETWTFADLKTSVFDANPTTDGIVYASAINAGNTNDDTNYICKLYRSEDKGKTWETVEGQLFYGYRISFFSSNIGIAYTGNVLQYTRDGGASWNLLIYPYKIE